MNFMAAKTNDRPRPATSLIGGLTKPGFRQTPPGTMAERLQHIESMGQLIAGYVQFIGQIGSLNGSSAEAKEQAVTAFYERMLVAERQLGRIQEDLRLG